MPDLKNKFNRIMKDLADNAGEQIKETGKYATEGLKDGTLKFSTKMAEAGKGAADQAKKTGGQLYGFGKGVADRTRTTVENLPKDQNGKIDVKASIKKMSSDALDAVDQNLKDQKESRQWKKEVLEEIKNKKKPFNLNEYSCLILVYCVMNADGNLSSEEEQKFQVICSEFNPSINSLEVLSTIKDEMQDIDVTELANKTLEEAVNSTDGTVNPKLLIWDLVVVAWSDRAYTEKERDLISTIREKLNIDETVQMEMEQSYRTIIALEKEREQISQAGICEEEKTSKSTELDKRIDVIRSSINALVLD